MDYQLEDLLDISLLQNLMEKLNVIYSFPSAIIDNNGKILTSVAWQDICKKYHRTNPESEMECVKSDHYIFEHIHEADPFITYKCPHGLVDNAIPIIIGGRHLGNFFTGQFFLEKPDLEFFKNQAKKYDFDEKEYLEAVGNAPIWNEEKLSQYLDFAKDFIGLIAGVGLKNLKEIEINLALKKSEERNKAIIRSTSDWIWELDEQGKYCKCSEKVEQILGYTVDEIIGKSPFDLMSPDEAERIMPIFNEIIASKGSIFDLENWSIHKDGHKVCLLTNGFPVFDESGKIKGYIGADKVITDRKQAEYELLKAKDRAEEGDRLKTAFLANMSHEIRTHMNGILGFAGLLKEQRLTGEEQQEYISIIEKSGVRMLNIINDIIDISKIESGQMSLYVSKTDINEQIEFTYNFFKQEAAHKGLQLLFKKSLPARDAIILTDREKVYAILTNLVKNAIKFTSTGSVEVGYVLEATTRSNGYVVEKRQERKETTHTKPMLTFYVKDTGIGIPQNRQKAIFDRFVQADIGDTRAFQGAGLGLSISKAYVQMLEGKIGVESEEGKGSTFYFTLPYDCEFQDKNSYSVAEPEKVEVPRSYGLKILIAEDDEISEMLIVRGVKGYGREILKVKSGVEAVMTCRSNPDIDLVLMDIKMPEMNGYQATMEIRKFNKEVIIIAQTAFALIGDREKAIESGCNDYLTKPFDRDKISDIIKKYF
jgi:hypothetical protein